MGARVGVGVGGQGQGEGQWQVEGQGQGEGEDEGQAQASLRLKAQARARAEADLSKVGGHLLVGRRKLLAVAAPRRICVAHAGRRGWAAVDRRVCGEAAQNSRSHSPSLVFAKLFVVSSTTLEVRSKLAPCTDAASRRARASIPQTLAGTGV